VWRAAAWSLAGADRRVSTFSSAVAFTGALLGCLLISPRLPGVNTWGNSVRHAPLLAAAMALLLLAGVQAYLRWSLLCARSWLPVAGRPRLAYRFGVLQSAVVVGIWLSAWFGVMNLTSGLVPMWQALVLAVFGMGFNPPFLLSIAWTCAYPLATWQTRRMSARARTYPWWRPGGGDQPAITGTRTPLASITIAAAAIVAAYWISVQPLYPAIRRAVDRLAVQFDAPVAAMRPLAWLLLGPALAAAAGGLLVLGFVVGGRRRTSQAVAAGGAALVLASTGLFVLMVVHLTRASPIVRSLLTILSGLSGVGVGGPVPDDRPVNAAIGLMILALLAALLVVGLPAAMLGSLLRALRPSRPSRRPAGRPAWLAAALTAPLAIAGGGLGYVGWTEWRVPDVVVVTEAVDHRALEEVLGRPRGQDEPLDETCLAMLNTGFGLAPSSLRGDLALSVAHAAVYARSAEDRTLQTMGEGVIESLRKSELKQASRGLATSMRYCADALTYT
jgi:hypothetical protein